VQASPALAVTDESLGTIDTIQVEFDNQFSEFNPVIPELLLNCRRYRYLKRAVDLLCSLILLIVSAVPGLLIAAAIVLTSRGPVFYREERIGRGGKSFRIWKFRSMHRNAPHKSHIQARHAGGVVLEWRMCKQRRDPRITAVGGFLRRWSLDELPQLLNVLRGEMSLVGPRPIVESETVLYGDLLPYYLAATPGLSGAWQVSGRSEVDYDDRARLDAIYVSLWSLKTDIGILFRTLPAVLSRIGAY
jgi:undecaprenyl-phosphate galactose phosphotransferase